MNVGQVYNLFQSLVDDTDETFLTAANTATYLKAGYSDFREKVSSIDPNFYIVHKLMIVNTAKLQLDLTDPLLFPDGIPLLGEAAVAGGTLMNRLVRVASVACEAVGAGTVESSFNYYLIPANSGREVMYGDGAYCIDGQSMVVGSSRSGECFRFEYLKEPSILWTDISTGYVDDLAPHHQLIALYAALDNVLRLISDPSLKPILLQVALVTARIILLRNASFLDGKNGCPGN